MRETDVNRETEREKERRDVSKAASRVGYARP